MVKIISNNLTIDLCKKERFLKYLPQQDRYVEVKQYCANSILGSDGNTIYHIYGTPFNFKESLRTVNVVKINEEEYQKLKSQIIIQNKQQDELQKEVYDLKKLVLEQNKLIAQLLERL